MILYNDIENLSQIFSIKWIVTTAIIGIFMAVVVLLCSKKFLQIIQQSGYKLGGYKDWLARRGNVYPVRVAMLSLLSILAYLLIETAFSFVKNAIICYLGLSVVVIFLIVFLFGDKKHKDKCPIVFTARMKRLYFTVGVVAEVLAFLIVSLINVWGFFLRNVELFCRLRLVVVLVLPLLVPVIVAFATIINAPFENLNNKKYIKRCAQKLQNMDSLIKIGITGSYAKTGVKEILKTILCEKFKVLATPNSFNTPLGICKTVENIDDDTEVFIAEMGAKHVGDIKELCDIVQPQIGVITGIAGQHLETFGNIETVEKTKFELCDAVDTVVLNGANERAFSFKALCLAKNKTVYCSCKSGTDVFCEDLKCDVHGSSFTLNVFGKKISTSTFLVGRHNVENICVAVTVAHLLGLTDEQIVSGILRLKPIAHRLEIIESSNGVTIVDDSYNSNEIGNDVAIELLKMFDGRKIVVTPGLVELGASAKAMNFDFGKKLASVCDFVLLVGNYCSFDIQKGLIDAKFDVDKIFMMKDLEDAKRKLSEILQKGDVVLFENDLPDKFL